MCHSRWAAQIPINPRLQISTAVSLCCSSHFSVVKSTDLSQSHNLKKKQARSRKKKIRLGCAPQQKCNFTCAQAPPHTLHWMYLNFNISISYDVHVAFIITGTGKKILYSIIQFESSYRSYQGSWKCFWRRWRNERLGEKNRRAGAEDFHIHPAYRVVIES